MRQNHAGFCFLVNILLEMLWRLTSQDVHTYWVWLCGVCQELQKVLFNTASTMSNNEMWKRRVEWNYSPHSASFATSGKTEIKLWLTKSCISTFIDISSQVAPIFIVDFRNSWRFLKIYVSFFINCCIYISYPIISRRKGHASILPNANWPSTINIGWWVEGDTQLTSAVCLGELSTLWHMERLYVKCT